MVNEQEYEHVNSKVSLGPLDSKAESSSMGRSLLLYSLLGKSGIIGNPPIFFTYSLVCLIR